MRFDIYKVSFIGIDIEELWFLKFLISQHKNKKYFLEKHHTRRSINQQEVRP